MCTYSQLKKKKIILCNPPRGSKLYASCGIDISKCIEGGSMKLATQVDYIYTGSPRVFKVFKSL